ncbi:signal peptidase I [Massilia sp. CCM 9210]|uniref:signal peptidase I n=1 Tax=Massilia scottii TaxID=3057166 RepID=UPI002796C1E1|nr:signal peptidase I [Massilia sp. CCM 9210]MDQ1815931.1 signal peptidase I [Massilia sp. CCM 9210]
MNWKPNKWIATALNIFFSPLGLVYAGAPRLAALVFGGALLLMCAIFFLLPGPLSATVMVAFQVALAVLCMSAAYLIAARAPVRAVRPVSTRWHVLLAIMLTYFTTVVGLRAFFYETFRAPSTSMAPAIESGAHLLVQKWGYGHASTFGITFASRPISAPMTRGDLIVFDFSLDPSQQYIKRLVGLPGDKVAYRDRQLFINGAATRVRELEAYLDPEQLVAFQRFEEQLGNVRFQILLRTGEARSIKEPDDFAFKENCVHEAMAMQCEVPPGHYFVMGDNRDNSYDSRYWGFVRANQVVGKVVRIMQ